ncbi:hypothetical protein SAMN05444483_10868 [Salegentibacter echinorum]|uniref:Uncharacterized protein n=1 Tax=Salegentibacter echinorum TaxID=1073325 RepID=A0A1M5INW9_SALEC|nr:hypothetical protein SAMN05444483_10868 [Salegentibacter echinorum]
MEVWFKELRNRYFEKFIHIFESIHVLRGSVFKIFLNLNDKKTL